MLPYSGDSLFTARDHGSYLIGANSNIVLLALLGKIYPENMTVVDMVQSLEGRV